MPHGDKEVVFAPPRCNDVPCIFCGQFHMHAAIIRVRVNMSEFAANHEGVGIAVTAFMQNKSAGSWHGDATMFVVHFGQRKTPVVKSFDHVVGPVLGQL